MVPFSTIVPIAILLSGSFGINAIFSGTIGIRLVCEGTNISISTKGDRRTAFLLISGPTSPVNFIPQLSIRLFSF